MKEEEQSEQVNPIIQTSTTAELLTKECFRIMGFDGGGCSLPNLNGVGNVARTEKYHDDLSLLVSIHEKVWNIVGNSGKIEVSKTLILRTSDILELPHRVAKRSPQHCTKV